MLDDTLQQAIGLIRAGRKGEAQPLLQNLIKANPGDIAAWLWYVDTCQTSAERLKVLETCARLNPGHPQVEKALAALRPVPSSPNTDLDPATSPSQPEPVATWDVPKSWDPTPYEPPQAQPAWEYTPPPPPPPRPEPPARSYPWYEVWWTVVSYRPVEEFEDLLRDPTAKVGRAYLWTGISGAISSLLGTLIVLALFSMLVEAIGMPQVQDVLLPNTGQTLLSVAICIPFSVLGSLLNLILVAAIQNFLASTFGGTGNYSRTVYMLGAIYAPLACVSIILIPLFMIPFLNYCFMLIFTGFFAMLNIRALMAAHQINFIKALGVILLPGMLVLILSCIFWSIIEPSMSDVFQQIQTLATPTY